MYKELSREDKPTIKALGERRFSWLPATDQCKTAQEVLEGLVVPDPLNPEASEDCFSAFPLSGRRLCQREGGSPEANELPSRSKRDTWRDARSHVPRKPPRQVPRLWLEVHHA